ncbi:hypothetical protein PsorP6_008944 [Peronosclerospora sorghi]|uniref:Uncharacterized protein n=1 Tax=Peronosclerospora sorghi TaxID=230839 RepID=A0ACC0W098_9STRA|nr:hypothetical protein PsorP6_008944 [Peronosclerospora sorghi]
MHTVLSASAFSNRDSKTVSLSVTPPLAFVPSSAPDDAVRLFKFHFALLLLGLILSALYSSANVFSSFFSRSIAVNSYWKASTAGTKLNRAGERHELRV